ncbi:MAG: ATP-binding cassette, subfamily bacterial [Thermoleophilaceae bacterium]|nr:ATP-binding cassette, subfamily bacterial [Thermoleophilaceae bacterium]
MRQLRRFVNESPGLLAIGVATAVAQSALLLPIAMVIRSVFDHHLGGGDEGHIVLAGVLILGLYSAAALLGFLSRKAVTGMTTAIAARLRDDLIVKLHELPQSWHDRQRAGDVHALIVQDSDRVERMLSEVANPILPSALVAATLTVLALVLNPILFLTLAVVVPALITVAYVVGRRARSRAEIWAHAGRDFATDVHRMLRAGALTRVQGAEQHQFERGHELSMRLATTMRVLGVARGAYAAASNALSAVAGSLVLIVGGIAVARNAITLGDLLGFYAVLALLLRQLQGVSAASHDVAVGLESLSRIEAFLNTPAEEPYARGTATPEFRGGIALEAVTFAYEAAPVLHEVNLVIQPSERVAIVGPNGAGKSTLVGIVMGLYKPGAGRVLADGVPFEQLDMRSFRRQVGVVLQDPVLFPGTIAENIAFGRPDASEADIQAAAEAATAHGFVEQLPDGYDTGVGDEGVGLSGGQRQRVAIARALLGSPGMLLLDEPTTYLDEAAVTALMANLARLPRTPTVVLVTHDPQAAGHADRVIELRDGRVVADRSRHRVPA